MIFDKDGYEAAPPPAPLSPPRKVYANRSETHFSHAWCAEGCRDPLVGGVGEILRWGNLRHGQTQAEAEAAALNHSRETGHSVRAVYLTEKLLRAQ